MKSDKRSTGSPGFHGDPDHRRYLAALILFHQAAADAVGLSGTDYQASNLLDVDGPMTSGELARRLAITTGATTRLVDRLIASGIARRTTDPDDRRRALIAHTGHLPAGLAEILSTVGPPIQQALDDLTPEQRTGVTAYTRTASQLYSAAARALHKTT